MEVHAARKVVRRQNAFGGNERTVCAAAHGNRFGRNVQRVHGVVNIIDGFAVVIGNGVGNVAVRIGNGAFDDGAGVGSLQFFDVFGNTPFLFFV